MSSHLRATRATDVLDQLRELYVERALAAIEGLDADIAYATDLQAEIAACRAAYVGTAVIEIATLRAELSAPLVG